MIVINNLPFLGFQQPGGYAPQPGFVQPPPEGGYGGPGYDSETGDVKNFEFSDQSIRKGFIRKVYLILTVSSSEKFMTHTA